MGIDAVWLINDLAATACAIPFLSPEDFEVIQAGAPVSEGRISVVSAGTGLGQAFLIPERNGKFIVMDSEGGHCDFSPRNSVEAELLFFLQKKIRTKAPTIMANSYLRPLKSYVPNDDLIGNY